MTGGGDQTTNGGVPIQADDGEAAERAIEGEIRLLRGELDQMVGELDRRRHEAFDVRLQLRRHARLVAVAGGVGVVVVIGGVVAWYAARRRQDRLVVRLQNLAHAVAIASRHPDRLADAIAQQAPARQALGAVAKVAEALV